MSLRVKIGIVGILVYLFTVFLLGTEMQAAEDLKNRLEKLGSGPRIENSAESRLRLPITERFLLPAFRRISGTLGMILPLNQKSQEQLAEFLKSAGIKKKPNEFFGILVTILILSAAAVYFAARVLMHKSGTDLLIALVYGFAFLYVGARFYLKSRVTKRLDNIENSLPEVLDLLSVSVSAGLGFDQALQYVVEKCQGELSEELAVVQREIKMGRPRNEALKAMSDRCKAESLRVFVSAVIQADSLGIAIAGILSIQADAVRARHKQRIEEKAAKLPVKILLPLVFFIFPNIFIVLMGPAVPMLINGLSG